MSAKTLGILISLKPDKQFEHIRKSISDRFRRNFNSDVRARFNVVRQVAENGRNCHSHAVRHGR